MQHKKMFQRLTLMLLVTMVLALGAPMAPAAHATGSLEALVVTTGSIEIAIDGAETTTVRAGQSMIFTAHRAHEYRNTRKRAAEFHLAVFDPIDDGAVR